MKRHRSYRELTLWEKLGVWGALASILGLLATAAIILPGNDQNRAESGDDAEAQPSEEQPVEKEPQRSHQNEDGGVDSEHATTSGAPPSRDSSISSNSSNSVRIRRIIGAAYSYSESAWAREGLGSNKPPRISLAFWSGLVAGARFGWEGSYRINPTELCLVIRDVRMPVDLPILSDHYTDFALGYGVELAGGTFADHTMARTLLLYRTFVGDQPPPEIEKCFAVRHPEGTQATSLRLRGRWEGNYTQSGGAQGSTSSTQFVARLTQSGDGIAGTIVDSLESTKGARASVLRKVKARAEGLVTDGRVSLVKRYEGSTIGVSYVAAINEGATHLEGTWYAGVERGSWQMRRVGDLEGFPEEVLSADSVNPPTAPSDSG